MGSGYELEGNMRLEQVRKTKFYLYVVQLIVVLFAVILLVTLGGGVSMKPFYLPSSSFIYFVILMGLVFGIESFVFALLEIRFTKSQSSKYYIVKSAIRRSLIIIVVCAVVIVVFLTPFLNDFIANYASESGKTSSTAMFNNRDPLGLTSVDYVRVSSVAPCEVLIISAAYYEIYHDNLASLRQFSVASTFDATRGISFPFPLAEHSEYLIVAIGGEITYTVHKVLTPTFTNYVAFFAVLGMASFAAWVAYLMPKRKRYMQGTIYR